jgi:hypothetical protein
LPGVTVSPQGVATVVVSGQSSNFIVSPGIDEANLNLQIIGDNSSVTSISEAIVNTDGSAMQPPENVIVSLVGNNNTASGGNGEHGFVIGAG